jgi:hypothetical protein
MALKHGTAGKSTREMEMRRYFSRVFVVLAGIAIGRRNSWKFFMMLKVPMVT